METKRPTRITPLRKMPDTIEELLVRLEQREETIRLLNEALSLALDDLTAPGRAA
jgi:hypothetical protein